MTTHAYMRPNTWTLCSLYLRRNHIPSSLVMSIRDFVDPQLKIRIAKEATYTFHANTVFPAKRQYKSVYESIIAPAKTDYERCKARSNIQGNAASTIDSQPTCDEEVQRAKDTYYALYKSVLLPAKDAYETLDKEYVRRLSYIDAQCTHPNKKRRREEGLYGERYFECPDCNTEWW